MNKSIIKNITYGLFVIVILMLTTVSVLMYGADRIFYQLKTVSTEAFPLVSQANITHIKLLSADKAFKDFVTSQTSEQFAEYEKNFTVAQQAFQKSFGELSAMAVSYAGNEDHIQALEAIEERFFDEAHQAMQQYRAQLAAQQARQQANRRFQSLQVQLKLGLKEYILDQNNPAIEVMSESYFKLLAKTESTTSDALMSHDQLMIKKALKDNKRSVMRLNYAFDVLAGQLPAIKELHGEAFAQFRQDIGQRGGVLDQHLKAVEANQRLYNSINNLTAEIDLADGLLNALRVQAEQEMQQTITKSEHNYDYGVGLSVSMAALATLISIALGWRLARSVRLPLTEMLQVLESLTAGDMTRRVARNDFIEFEQLSFHINSLATNLQDVIQDLNFASSNLNEVAKANIDTTTDMQHRLSEQREQTDSVASAMTEMDHSVADIARSAQQTLDRVFDVERVVNDGVKVMEQNITTTHHLAEKIEHSAQTVQQVKTMSDSIGSILDVIRGITEQTNLLALNAAIEAARAGDQGRGFAVVADQVRVLASRTIESTSAIEEMITSLQLGTDKASLVMQQCLGQMDKSVKDTSFANTSMEEIQTLVAEISQMSSLISTAAAQQSHTSREITSNLVEISSIADESQRAIQGVAKDSQSLESLAKAQDIIVNKFMI